MISGKSNATGEVARHQISFEAGADSLLSFAAAPVFAFMALATALSGSTGPDILCATMHGPSPIGGMVPMYLLMSLFHSGPWLKLAVIRKSGARK